MRLSYIYHSGFLLEFDDFNIIIDYYKGDIKEFDRSKKLYVLSSHAHRDHFNKSILKMFDDCSDVEYILSDDISVNGHNKQKISYVSPNNTYDFGKIKVETLKSTDEGVAFIITEVHTDKSKEKIIYHSGDLNWWTWYGYESEEEYELMTKNYKSEIEKIKGRNFYLCLAVLDPRQKERYDWGLKYLLDNVSTKYICPMHLWDKYKIVEQFCNDNEGYVKDIEVINPNDIRNGIDL